MTNIDRTAPEPTPQAEPRPTYPQDWTNYNLAQTNEKRLFLSLFKDLCETIPQPPQGRGRPRLPLADTVFATVFKIYSGFSARRFTTDIQAAVTDGLIDHAPHFNSTNRYLANPDLGPVLKSLIEASAAPLAAVESSFAIDSTGFSTCHYIRWFDHKWGKERSRKRFIKTHLVTGVKTNIVTAADAMAYESPDAPQLPGLLNKTAETFKVREVNGDKAYSSRSNIHAIDALGAASYIPFQRNATGSSKKRPHDPLWSRLFHYFHFEQEAFSRHYHQRSNVETTMSMIKGKFGGSVKSKSPVAQVNEVLCKVLAHNLVVLVQALYELGIEAKFSTHSGPEPKVVDLNQYRSQHRL